MGNADREYAFLEGEERKIISEFHNDNAKREKVIKDAMSKIVELKLFVDESIENLVFLGDQVELILDYGNDDVVVEEKILSTCHDENSISIYSNIGEAIYAQAVGSTIVVDLPNGRKVNVTIESKNKQKTLSK